MILGVCRGMQVLGITKLQLQGKSTPHFESFVQLCSFWAGEEVRFKGGVRIDFEICTSFLVPCNQLIPHLRHESHLSSTPECAQLHKRLKMRLLSFQEPLIIDALVCQGDYQTIKYMPTGFNYYQQFVDIFLLIISNLYLSCSQLSLLCDNFVIQFRSIY